MIRYQTYLLLMSNTSKENFISYDRFKNEYWKFNWDTFKERVEEGVMSEEQWHNLISRTVNVKVIK